MMEKNFDKLRAAEKSINEFYADLPDGAFETNSNSRASLLDLFYAKDETFLNDVWAPFWDSFAVDMNTNGPRFIDELREHAESLLAKYEDWLEAQELAARYLSIVRRLVIEMEKNEAAGSILDRDVFPDDLTSDLQIFWRELVPSKDPAKNSWRVSLRLHPTVTEIEVLPSKKEYYPSHFFRVLDIPGGQEFSKVFADLDAAFNRHKNQSASIYSQVDILRFRLEIMRLVKYKYEPFGYVRNWERLTGQEQTSVFEKNHPDNRKYGSGQKLRYYALCTLATIRVLAEKEELEGKKLSDLNELISKMKFSVSKKRIVYDVNSRLFLLVKIRDVPTLQSELEKWFEEDAAEYLRKRLDGLIERRIASFKMLLKALISSTAFTMYNEFNRVCIGQ